MITCESLFAPDAVNIFTDASILKRPGEFIGCPGYLVVIGDTVVESDKRILRHSTSNNSEINAVKMGVIAALKYKQYRAIRLFSDSQLCIYGLRDRIYKWIRNQYNGVLMTAQMAPVMNQDVFVEILNIIVANQLQINFYYQRGHINTANPKDIVRAKESFIRCNRVRIDVSDALIKRISMYNNMIDCDTRNYLNSIQNIDSYDSPMEPVRFRYNPAFDAGAYESLTHNGRRKFT